MATFTVKIRDSAGVVVPGVTFDPATLTIPDDVFVKRSAPQGDNVILYNGHLKTPVTATFPDGRTIEFPERTIVDAIKKSGDSPSTITLKTKEVDGVITPLVLPHVLPSQGGGRRHRRRSTRARRTNRRHRRSVSRRLRA
jgi:hypothetical protein